MYSMRMEHPQSIVILDFGGQYAHLIASRVRRFGAYAQILPPETPASALQGAAGIILSGGPQSVYESGSPQADPKIFDLKIPILGLCYGLHWMTQALDGTVMQGKVKEYGRTRIRVEGSGSCQRSMLFHACPEEFVVWMSHGDEATELPAGFVRTATSDACANAAFEDPKRKLFALQFHPEVTHTQHGNDILRSFVELCNPAPWSVKSYAAHIGDVIRSEVEDHKVFMLVSGGVDSTVAFTLLDSILGTDRVQGLLVDTGLMRKDEVRQIEEALGKLKLPNLRVEDASEEFFANLTGVYEPEAKRKVIGDTFVAVQQRVSAEMGLTAEQGWMLGQGTIYPDTIETGGTKHADQIKTHHNRVQMIQEMIDKGLVVEPLKDLYKDEVRKLGEELGLPHDLVWRHPFPGPGLGVRILCAEKPDVVDVPSVENQKPGIRSQVLPVKSVGVQGDGRTYRHALALFCEDPFSVPPEVERLATEIPNTTPQINRVLLSMSHAEPVPFVFTPGFLSRERANLLREADAMVMEEVRKAGLYEAIWQFPVVLLPFGTRTGGQSIVLRPIESTDAMTADAAHLPESALRAMIERIMTLSGIDMVFLDLTSKPPATIEWE
ncbi:glutamine-hydrolyzing GMP synthase [Candidatus Peregrinibacteria bacterium CG10_big_fil_rev_8_21_14_0_10_55_24]|nr:MAG: glutamine-hydrolyzing GMP synthase [Candidatus Peregrinibacteria bacterium CG10_big_fil_rev_8_21_14_0_10_55_24]